MPHNTIVNNTNNTKTTSNNTKQYLTILNKKRELNINSENAVSRVQLQMVHRNDFYNKSNNCNNSLFKTFLKIVCLEGFFKSFNSKTIAGVLWYLIPENWCTNRESSCTVLLPILPPFLTKEPLSADLKALEGL